MSSFPFFFSTTIFIFLFKKFVYCKETEIFHQNEPQPSLYGTFKHTSLLRVNSDAESNPPIIENDFSFSPRNLDLGTLEQFVPVETVIHFASYFHVNDKIVTSVNHILGITLNPEPIYTFVYGEVKDIHLRYVPYKVGVHKMNLVFSGPGVSVTYEINVNVVASKTNLQAIFGHKIEINTTVDATLEMTNPFASEITITELYTTNDQIKLSSNDVAMLWTIPPASTGTIIRLHLYELEPSTVTGYVYIHTNFGVYAVPIEVVFQEPRLPYKTTNITVTFLEYGDITYRSLFSSVRDLKVYSKVECYNCSCDIIKVNRYVKPLKVATDYYEYAQVAIKGCGVGKFLARVYIYTDVQLKTLDSVLVISANVLKGKMTYEQRRTFIGANVDASFGVPTDIVLPLTSTFTSPLTITSITSTDSNVLAITSDISFPYSWPASSVFSLKLRVNITDKWMSKSINISILGEKEWFVPFEIYNGYPLLANVDEQPHITNPIHDGLFPEPLPPFEYAFTTSPAIDRPLRCLFSNMVFGQSRYRTVVLINNNPISLTVDYGTPPVPGVQYFAKGIVPKKGNFTHPIRDFIPLNRTLTVQPNQTQFTLYPNDALYIIIEVTAHPNHTEDMELSTAFSVKEKWIEPHALILPMSDKFGRYFSQLYVLVGYSGFTGTLKFIPYPTVIKSVFQGEITKTSISLVSSYPEILHIQNASVTDNKLEISLDQFTILPNDFNVIGTITFNPKSICELANGLCDQILSGSDVHLNDYEKEPFPFETFDELDQYTKKYDDLRRKGINITAMLSIDSDELSNINLPVQVQVSFPTLINALGEKYAFTPIPVNSRINSSIAVYNPTNRNGVFQFVFPPWEKCECFGINANFTKPFLLMADQTLASSSLGFQPNAAQFYECTLILRSSIAPPILVGFEGQGEIEKLQFKQFLGYNITSLLNLDKKMLKGIEVSEFDRIIEDYQEYPPLLNGTITVLNYDVRTENIPTDPKSTLLWGVPRIVGFTNTGNVPLTIEGFGFNRQVYDVFVLSYFSSYDFSLKPTESATLVIIYKPSCKLLEETAELYLRTNDNIFTMNLRGVLPQNLIKQCNEGKYNQILEKYGYIRYSLLFLFFLIEVGCIFSLITDYQDWLKRQFIHFANTLPHPEKRLVPGMPLSVQKPIPVDNKTKKTKNKPKKKNDEKLLLNPSDAHDIDPRLIGRPGPTSDLNVPSDRQSDLSIPSEESSTERFNLTPSKTPSPGLSSTSSKSDQAPFNPTIKPPTTSRTFFNPMESPEILYPSKSEQSMSDHSGHSPLYASLSSPLDGSEPIDMDSYQQQYYQQYPSRLPINHQNLPPDMMSQPNNYSPDYYPLYNRPPTESYYTNPPPAPKTVKLQNLDESIVAMTDGSPEFREEQQYPNRYPEAEYEGDYYNPMYFDRNTVPPNDNQYYQNRYYSDYQYSRDFNPGSRTHEQHYPNHFYPPNTPPPGFGDSPSPPSRPTYYGSPMYHFTQSPLPNDNENDSHNVK